MYSETVTSECFFKVFFLTVLPLPPRAIDIFQLGKTHILSSFISVLLQRPDIGSVWGGEYKKRMVAVHQKNLITGCSLPTD